MKLEELLHVMTLDNADPVNYTIFDLDGNWVNRDELFVLDYYQMREWLVERIRVHEDGSVDIVVNSGNLVNFRIRNVHWKLPKLD